MENQQKPLKEQNIEAHSETERWFALPDINFLTMDSSNQEETLDSFAKYISRLPCGYTVKLVFKKEAINAKKEYPLLEEKGDEFDIYRASLNKEITAPLYSQYKDKIFLCIKAKTEQAVQDLDRTANYFIDSLFNIKVKATSLSPKEVSETFKEIRKCSCKRKAYCYNWNSSEQDILRPLLSTPKVLTEIIFYPLERKDSLAYVRKKNIDAKLDVINWEKRRLPENPDLGEAIMKACELREAVAVQGENLFYINAVTTAYGNTEEESAHLIENVISSAKNVGLKFKHSSQIKTLFKRKPSVCGREEIRKFFPFQLADLNESEGIYVGRHLFNSRPVFLNSPCTFPMNRLICGNSGSGKTFVKHNEIAQKILGTEDSVIMVGEWFDGFPLDIEFVEKLGGASVTLAPDGEYYINPFDIVGITEENVRSKYDLASSLTEFLSLEYNKRSLITREVNALWIAVNEVYDQYRQDSEAAKMYSPTFSDIYYQLKNNNIDGTITELLTALAPFCEGERAFFSHQTNLPSARLLCLDCSYREKHYVLNRLIIAEYVKNRMHIQRKINKKNNKNCPPFKYKNLWVYLDYSSFKQPTIEEFYISNLKDIAVKGRRSCTGLVLTAHSFAEIIEHAPCLVTCVSSFIFLSQSPLDRQEMKKYFRFSDNELDFITDKPCGTGLIYKNGTSPFKLSFDSKGDYYRLLASGYGGRRGHYNVIIDADLERMLQELGNERIPVKFSEEAKRSLQAKRFNNLAEAITQQILNEAAFYEKPEEFCNKITRLISRKARTALNKRSKDL